MVFSMEFRKEASRTVKRLYRCMVRWWKHEHANTAASLAFYSLISLVPILICGVWIASLMVGEKIAKASLVDGANSIAGKSVSDYFGKLLSSDISWFGSGVSPIIGGLFLLYAATKVITKLRMSLGGIFGTPRHKGKRALIATAMNRGISIVLLFFLGGFIACAVVVETILALVMNSVSGSFLFKLMTYSAPLLTFIAVVLLSAVAMRWLPQRAPTFRNAIYGGIVSAVLLGLLKFALTTFLKYAEVGSYYGSSLALVLVLFWIYFAMQAFLFGAEYAAELAREQRQVQYVDDRLADDHVEYTEHEELEHLAKKENEGTTQENEDDSVEPEKTLEAQNVEVVAEKDITEAGVKLVSDKKNESL